MDGWLPHFGPTQFTDHFRVVRVGPLRVGVDFDPSFDLSRIHWLEPPGVSVDMHIALRVAERPGFAAASPPAWVRDAQTGVVDLANERIRGRLDVASGQGALACLAVADDIALQGKVMADAFIAGAVALVQERGGLAVHAATLWLDGRAWLVAGASGRGKSTLARRFPGQHLHEEHAFLVPDGPDGVDRGAAATAHRGWRMWRLPQFRGPYETHLPYDTPLGAVYELGTERDETRVVALHRAGRFAAVMRNAYLTADLPSLVRAVERLSTDVPVGALRHSLWTPAAALGAAIVGGPARLATGLEEAS